MNAIADFLRKMAWQRAKGELLSILEAYDSAEGLGNHEEFKAMEQRIKSFIKAVEDNW